VALLDQLTEAAHTRRAVAGYYQGLAGVRAYGMYDETRAYVANVLALKRSFERGDYPG
jgi:N-acetylmuramoyl-L-alanine amidase